MVELIAAIDIAKEIIPMSDRVDVTLRRSATKGQAQSGVK